MRDRPRPAVPGALLLAALATAALAACGPAGGEPPAAPPAAGHPFDPSAARVGESVADLRIEALEAVRVEGREESSRTPRSDVCGASAFADRLRGPRAPS